MRVSQAGPVEIRQGPSAESQPIPWVVQHPGAVVLTTGRIQGSWMEVRYAHLGTGWAPLAAFVPCQGGGTHGDEFEPMGAADAVLNEHNQINLRFDVRAPTFLHGSVHERGPR